MPRILPLAILLISVGCPSEDEGPPLAAPLTYEEDDDGGNHRRTFAEEIDGDWSAGLTITGSMAACGADENGSEWEYTEDRDYYEFEIFADGWLEVSLDWDEGSDLDMAVRTNGRDRHMLDDTDDQPVEYAREDVHDEGDDISVGVFCKTGEPTDYTITVELELD